MDSVFIARMERILWLYSLPYDPRFPVLCYDERPCFLIGELIKGFSMKANQPVREHYAYEKKGACNLLASIEPLTGRRIVDVFDQRRKKEFALHFKRVAEEFAEAEKIRVVLDNLNTHNASAFYETFPAEEAFALAQKARVLLHAAPCELAQYDRDRVFCHFTTMFGQTHSNERRVERRSLSHCQRTK